MPGFSHIHNIRCLHRCLATPATNTPLRQAEAEAEWRVDADTRQPYAIMLEAVGICYKMIHITHNRRLRLPLLERRRYATGHVD